MASTMAKLDTAEKKRLKALCQLEREAYLDGYRFIAGIDEAGRGPLAGPVVAAACIIPNNHFIAGIDDSKKLSEKARNQAYLAITSDPRLSYAVAIVDHLVVDAINIYQATIQAMLQAAAQLSTQPDILFVDGMLLPHPHLPVRKIIGGDTLSQSIAAASILAKVTRDRLMIEYHEQWPEYGFSQHKGYGTAKHLEALSKYGPCPIHRRSFEPVHKVS